MTEAAEQRWFAGVPVTGERTLTAEEIGAVAEFRKEIRNAAIKTYGILAGMFALLVTGDVLDFEVLYRWWIILCILLFIARGGGLHAAQYVRWYRETGVDARNGIVAICSGSTAQAVIDVAQLTGRDVLTVFRDQETLSLEVLPRSAMVWTYNGRRTVQPTFVRRSRTSAAPEHARMAANFVKPVEGSEGVFSHQRPLNESESEELRAYLPVIPPVQVVIALIMALIGAWSLASSIDPIDFVMVTAGAGLLIISVSRLFWIARRLRFLKALRADVEENIVVIVRQTVEGGLGEPVEFLPHSRWVWTTDGQPATWRRISARR